MNEKQSDDVRRSVREAYASVAATGGGCCRSTTEPSSEPTAKSAAGMGRKLGYSDEELAAVSVIE
jgi:hypothetical protein